MQTTTIDCVAKVNPIQLIPEMNIWKAIITDLMLSATSAYEVHNYSLICKTFREFCKSIIEDMHAVYCYDNKQRLHYISRGRSFRSDRMCTTADMYAQVRFVTTINHATVKVITEFDQIKGKHVTAPTPVKPLRWRHYCGEPVTVEYGFSRPVEDFDLIAWNEKFWPDVVIPLYTCDIVPARDLLNDTSAVSTAGDFEGPVELRPAETGRAQVSLSDSGTSDFVNNRLSFYKDLKSLSVYENGPFLSDGKEDKDATRGTSIKSSTCHKLLKLPEGTKRLFMTDVSTPGSPFIIDIVSSLVEVKLKYVSNIDLGSSLAGLDLASSRLVKLIIEASEITTTAHGNNDLAIVKLPPTLKKLELVDVVFSSKTILHHSVDLKDIHMKHVVNLERLII